ncbi:MAG: type II secretion system F family protein [Kiritimatiellae bacterium]|nr:type II secretion system F family protein [Kiritimatiellia bacterium]
MSPVVRATSSSTKKNSTAKTNNKQNSPKKKGGKQKKVPGSRKIVNELLPAFSRQLAAMLTSGMPIVASLEALEEQTDNPGFKTVITRVKAAIEGGAAFSEALALYPYIFDDLYVNMIRGGESGGQLAETIARLATFMEAASRLKRKVKSAMMYPVIVLCISIALAIGMIVFIVPVFGNMFSDFGAELPKPTQFLIDVSDFIKAYGLYVGGVIGVALFFFNKWKATPEGGLAVDQAKLKMPVFGELTSKVAAARFARTLGQLIASGVPILSALDIVAGATGNKAAGKVVMNAYTAVENGDPLSSAMLEQTAFPKMLVRMLQAGEKTGKIDVMMDNIADFYDDEVETMLEGLTILLEPLLMVFLGVIIGGIVLCMFMPIFKMSEVVNF